MVVYGTTPISNFMSLSGHSCFDNTLISVDCAVDLTCYHLYANVYREKGWVRTPLIHLKHAALTANTQDFYDCVLLVSAAVQV